MVRETRAQPAEHITVVMVYVLSGRETLVEQLRAALKTSVLHVRNPTMFVELASARARRRQSCLIIDLSTLPDPRAAVTAAKRSPVIGHIPVILFGTRQEHDALTDDVRSAVNGFITSSVTAQELEAAIKSLCQIRSRSGAALRREQRNARN